MANRPEKTTACLANASEGTKRTYIEGLLRVVTGGEAVSEPQLRVLYRVFAVVGVQREDRQGFVRHLFAKKPTGRLASPPFADGATRVSFAKDALTMASSGPTEGRHERVEKVQRRLGLEDTVANLLWEWIRWEDRILAGIKKGDLVIRRGYSPYRVLAKAQALGIPQRGFYLSGTTVALAAVGVPRGGAAAFPNRFLVALGADLRSAWMVIDLLEAGDILPAPGEVITENLGGVHAVATSAMEAARALRDRYLLYLEEDLESLGGKDLVNVPRPEATLGRLAEALPALWKNDRVIVPMPRKTAARKSARDNPVLRTLVQFANINIEKESTEASVLWTRRLLGLSQYSGAQANFGCSLRDIQKEIRQILRDLAAGHPWASSEEYARLANNRGLDSEDDALNLFSLGSSGASILPVYIAIMWEHSPGGMIENMIPWDPRSCLIMATRAELKKKHSPRLLKCPVCRMFFIQTSHRRYCSDECRVKGNELLRDREARNAQRCERYWKKKRHAKPA